MSTKLLHEVLLRLTPEDDGEPLGAREMSRGELLRAGRDRVKRAGAAAASVAIEQTLDRFVPHVQRPPGALPEVEFLIACTRCGACSDACPPGAILVLGQQAGLAAGTPWMDVNAHRPCVVCRNAPCMPACPTGALQVIPMADAVLGTAEIDRDACFAWQGKECGRCVPICPWKEEAILLDDEGRPWVDPRACIGCGLCRRVCPSEPNAITVKLPPRL